MAKVDVKIRNNKRMSYQDHELMKKQSRKGKYIKSHKRITIEEVSHCETRGAY